MAKNKYAGIRKKDNGKFIATKYVDGKRTYKQFDTIREAQNWKNEVTLASLKIKPSYNYVPSYHSPKEEIFYNGRNKSITLGEVYELYLKGPINLLSRGTKYQTEAKLNRFLQPLLSTPLSLLTPEIITDHLKFCIVSSTNSRRCNFNEELKKFKAVLNWYREEKDHTFSVPITLYHKRIGEIKKVPKKDKVLTPEQFFQFLDHLDEPFSTLALVQYYYALRVSEVTALTTSCVDFQEKKIKIAQSFEFLGGFKPDLRDTTKTGVSTELDLIEEVEERLKALDAVRPKRCEFFFNKEGKSLSYDTVYNTYKKALAKAGIKVQGTHFLRFSMATLTRKLNGLDASQAILRHKSSKMSEHYAGLDPSKANETVIYAQDYFKKLRKKATIATNPEKAQKIQ